MKRLFALCIILTMTLALNGLVGADITWTSVTNNPYEDTSPQIKGNYLVWQGYVDGDWEIFLYNITTGETKQITENNYNDMSPQTDGDYVVWQGYSRTGGEIFLYEIGDDKTIEVTNDDNLDSSPQIADGLVVWTSHEVGDSVEPGDIFLYEVGSGVTYQLTDNILDDGSPRINGQEVMWVQIDEQGTTTKYLYDLPVGPAYEAPEGYVWRNSPQTDGDLTVLTRHDGTDREVFLYDSDSRDYHQITDNNLEDRYPSISGNYIVWMADGEIYFSTYTCPTLSGEGDGTQHGYGVFSWTWSPECEERRPEGSWPVALNEIFGNPKFVDMDKDGYRLATHSLAIGAGEGGIDMGTYGGPNAINDNDFPSADVYCLIDGGTSTDNAAPGGKDVTKLKLFALSIVLSIALSFVGYSRRTPP